MDNKLKDNEIIKAFKRITEYQGFTSSVSKTLKSTLDLINRLQSQNKELAETVHNLTIEKDALFDKAEELKTKVERLKKELMKCKLEKEMLHQTVEEIKSEAVKEFVEKLKEYATQGFWETDAYVGTEQIDNLLKETMGDSDDS